MPETFLSADAYTLVAYLSSPSPPLSPIPFFPFPGPPLINLGSIEVPVVTSLRYCLELQLTQSRPQHAVNIHAI